MFIPSKKELEELGFKKIRKYLHTLEISTDTPECEIIYMNMEWMIETRGITHPLYTIVNFYPQSIEDIKTLIKLLTPHEN